MSASLGAFAAPWRYHLDHNGDAKFRDTRKSQFPDYYHRQTAGQIADAGADADADADALITTSQIHSFQLGTGASIYTQSILPAILQARREIILVTCFWAPSDTLTALSNTIAQLAQERERRISQQGVAIEPLRIRICFSSRSLFQKLFHPNSKDGFVYPPHTWPSKLGLPAPEALRAGGIDLQVKTLFFLPFSVMHPKFVVIDRQRAWLPSCNVSWEPWLEGCIEISGSAVAKLMRFYQSVWETHLPALPPDSDARPPSSPELAPSWLTEIQSPASRFSPLSMDAIPTVLLPSSHHQNPCFRPFPWMDDPKPPLTPLNVAVSCLLEVAQRSIYIQTPNLTSAAVIDGILQALGRGVHVTIVTGKSMMLLEQIVTAGTTTARCLKSLIRRYHNLKGSASSAVQSHGGNPSGTNQDVDLEAGRPRLGRLHIAHFRPGLEYQAGGISEEPVQSHLKLTIVDDEYIVLGSGNMDRASWFTSQELGVLFRSVQFANIISSHVDDVLRTRTTPVFESGRARDD
ncbi:phospholipase d/transphosphatidylase [Apiospora arundinis]